MTAYSEIQLHRGIVIPGGKDIQLLPEFLYTPYTPEVFGIKYNIEIAFNSAFKADVTSWHTGIGSSPSMGKVGEAYFPDGLNSDRPGIIIVKNIILGTQPKTFEKNQDLITCLSEHHKDFLDKNKSLVKKLEDAEVNSVLIGKIL